MQVTVKKLPESKVEMSVVIPWEEWQGEMDHAAEHLGKDVKVAGFRPGKVPRDVIEKRFGKEALLMETVSHVVDHSYPKALAENKVNAIGRPEVKLGKTILGEPLEYSVITVVMPEVTLKEWKSGVKKINTEFAKKEATVPEEEIDKELTKLADMRAKLVTVNRPAETGDNVLVDFSVLQNGVLIENGKSEKHPLVLGKGVFIPGFEEQILGMKENEEKTFELTFPAEYHAKHLAGKPATFEVKLGVVQERQIPTVDDTFASGLGAFESLEKLKESMHQGMLEEAKKKQQEEHRAHILDSLVEQSSLEYPSILVEEEQSRMVHEFQTQVESMGMNFADYMAQMKKTEDEMKKEWEPQAKKRLAAHLILLSLAETQEIEVDSQTIEEEMNKTLQSYRNIKDIEKNIDMERLYTAIQGQLRNEKVFEFLEKI